MITAVLFDLDDTLFDHQHSSRLALDGVRQAHTCFDRFDRSELERTHAALLDALHPDVVAGRIRLDDARRERFRRLFAAAGVQASDDLVAATAAEYRRHYQSVRRPIAGAAMLLSMVRTRARVGIVTNNLLEEQQDKLRHCGLDQFVDALVVSEEAGVSKPDPAIFRLALEWLGCPASEAVMFGDSWTADIMGATAAGIRAVWLNRGGAAAPALGRVEGPGVPEIRSLEPVDDVMRVLFGE